MSDYEDDMDVDDATAKDAITFSSDSTNAKGKRSAANLPVEAEDSLPWYAQRRRLRDMADAAKGREVQTRYPG